MILLANTQINKYTNEHCRTVPIRWCLLCVFFPVVLLATWATQMLCCTNEFVQSHFSDVVLIVRYISKMATSGGGVVVDGVMLRLLQAILVLG